MPEIKHIFFDLDHTLWDFEANSRQTIYALYNDLDLAGKINCDPLEFYERYIVINDAKWALYRKNLITKERLRAERFVETFAAFGYYNEDFAIAFEKEYLGACPYKTILIDGAMEVVQYLSKSYQMSIITNGFFETQQIKLRESDLAPFFDKVFSSDQLGVNKPNRKIFLESMQTVGAKRRESVMIGDSLITDVLGAKNCGMAQVYFNPLREPHSEKISHEISKLHDLMDIF